ncbi:MAG: M20/M25/M40 family metallo-hydrolase [Nitrospirae bacterium]|nr:M20/M25/M40 family metallo-hydrolase [Nitrospirota bacterium]
MLTAMRKELLINKKRLVSTFIDLIKINSPSFEEDLLGRHLEKLFEHLDFRVTRQRYDRSFNIIARKKGSLKNVRSLLLSGHMDTIEPTEGIRYAVKGGIIRSTGETVLGADDKSAIAQILEAITALKEQNIPHGDIEVVITSAEEKGLCGAKNLDYKKIKSRHALVLDSGGPVGRIVVAAPTHVTYEMRVTGKPAHAGIEPEKGISAIRVASEIIAAVPDGRIDAVTTANIGMIRGGTATNVVPREVVINGEVRSHAPATLRAVSREIFDAARGIAKKRNARIHVKAGEEYQAFRISRKEPFLAYMDGIFLKAGIRPEHTVTGGGSDANIFNQHGIVTLNLSSGMQKVHSHDEFIQIEDLVNGAIIVAASVRDFAEFK